MTDIFPNNIKLLCRVYGLSFNDLARLAGTSQPTISRICSGKQNASAKMVDAIAAALHMDPWVLRTQPLSDSPEELKKVATAPVVPAKEKKEPLIRPAVPQGHVTPDVLLDDRARALAWATVCNSSDEELREDPELTMYMPTDDLAPGVPRGALLYLTVELSPGMPRLADHVFAVGTAKGLDGNPALVFGTPAVSLGQISVRTTSGAVVPVTGIVAYVDGWAVFKKYRPHLPLL